MTFSTDGFKRCFRCGKVLPYSKFGKHAGRSDGLQQECLSCRSKNRKYVTLNRVDNPRTGVCLSCGEKFVLLSKKRKYCSNICRSNFNESSLKRIEWREVNLARTMLYRAKRTATKKGLPFNIDIKDIQIPEFCPVLGLKLEKSKDNYSGNSPSLDKIRPENGYVKGNVRVISHRANTLKSNATVEELTKVLEDLKTILSEIEYDI